MASSDPSAEVSSKLTPTVSSSTRRSSTPRSWAAATSSAARPGTLTVTVSKNCRVGADARGERARALVHALGDPLEATGAVVHRVHAGHDREQHLGGADVGCRLLAPDVLLTRLQRETVGGVPVGVLRDADEAARQLPLEARAHGHVAGVRSAEAHRHAEALRRADGDVGAEVAGRLQQRHGQQVGRDDRDAARGLDGGDDRRRIPDASRGARVLHEDAERVGQSLAASRGIPLEGAGEGDLGELDADGLRPVRRAGPWSAAGHPRRR